MTKHHPEEQRKLIVKNYNEIYYWQDTCAKKLNLLFFKSFFSGCFVLLKKELISYFCKISLKNRKSNCEKNISLVFNELYCSSILYMVRLVFIFQDLFYCTNKVAKNHNQFWYFCHRGEKHFLVLAQNLICLFLSPHLCTSIKWMYITGKNVFFYDNVHF